MQDEADDDIDMDEWFAMSEAECDAIEAALVRQLDEHAARIALLPVRHQVAIQRHDILARIRKTRARMRDPAFVSIACLKQMLIEQLRKSQVRLLKLRIWRRSGLYPGEA